jgi:hypothetical protein
VASRFRRQITPHQAADLVGRKVGDRTPNVVGATLAEDMSTGAPAFAYLPLSGDLDDVYDDSREAYALLAASLQDTLTRASGTGDAVEAWKLVASVSWAPGVINTIEHGAGEYHRVTGRDPVWIAVPVFRCGVRGGYLDLPEYGATLETRHGWAALFPRDLVHGMSTARQTREAGYLRSHFLVEDVG